MRVIPYNLIGSLLLSKAFFLGFFFNIQHIYIYDLVQ